MEGFILILGILFQVSSIVLFFNPRFQTTFSTARLKVRVAGMLFLFALCIQLAGLVYSVNKHPLSNSTSQCIPGATMCDGGKDR